MENVDNRFIRTGMDGVPDANSIPSTDQSMVLAIINDIVRMQQNLDNMDISVKGV